MSTRRIATAATGEDVYVVVTRLTDAHVWNTAGTPALEAYNAANYDDYAIACTEQGDSGRYVFEMPGAIGAGVYDIEFRTVADTTPAEGDGTVDAGVAEWTGTAFVAAVDHRADVSALAFEASVQDTLDAAVGAESAASAAAGDAALIEGRLTAARAAHLDADISSRSAPGAQMDIVAAPNATAVTAIQAGLSTLTASQVWAHGTRTLSAFGTLAADIVSGVWGAATRTLSVFGFAVETDSASRTASQATGFATASDVATILNAIQALNGGGSGGGPIQYPPSSANVGELPSYNAGLYNPVIESSSSDELVLDLCGVRELFIKAVGDYNLVENGDVKNGADRGADHFINQAQRWLDLRSEHFSLYRRFLITLAPHEAVVPTPLIIAPKRLLIHTPDMVYDITNERKEQEEFFKLSRSLTSALPRMWSMVSHFGAVGSESPGKAGVEVAPSHRRRVLILSPPPSYEVEVEIFGKFFSKKLVECGDASLWTSEYPSLLVTVASMFYERMYGNATRVSTLQDIALAELDTIDTSVVQAEMNDRELDAEWNREW